MQDQLAQQLRLGQTNLEAAKTNLSQANIKHDIKLVDEAKRDFVAAKSDFVAAKSIAANSRLLSVVERLPEIGPGARSRHTAVDGISDMGSEIATAGLDLADLVARLIQPPSTGTQQGRTLLNIVQDTSQSIGSIKAELAKADAAAAGVDTKVLTVDQRTTFAKARSAIMTALASIDQFQALVPVLVEILGGNGVRNYLVEQVSPAELRPGGGFIGTYSVLRADHGTLKLVRSGSSTDLALPRPVEGQPGYVTPPGPMKQLVVKTNSWSFFDSNFFPDFPSNALAGERFAQPRLGFPLDGVVSFDYYTVARILDLTGPIDVPGYGIRLTSANFISTVISYDLAAVASKSADSTHKAILSAVAGPLMTRLTSLSPTLWPSLIFVLNDLVTQRHLQVYFNSAPVQAQLDKFGWTGVLYPMSEPDFIMNVESNLGATKASYFVTRQYTLSLSRSGAVLHHRLTVDLVDRMPYIYKPNDFYRVYIELLVSSKAASATDNLTRMILPNGSPPANTFALDGWTSMPGQGGHRTAVFVWDTAWQPAPDGVESLYWQKEPGTGADAIDVTWTGAQGQTLMVKGDLGQDRVVNLMPSAVTLTAGHEGAAQLPSLSLG